MSYLSDYLKTCENSKPAFCYHVWCMLSSLSAFAGRRFWFPFGPMNFYANLYVALVGDPGTGKTTAMNRAKNIIRAAGVTPVAATQITKEALTLEMSNEKFTGRKYFQHGDRVVEYNQYSIFASEIVEFIAVNPQGFLDFLTTVWDEPVYEVKTKHQGHDYVQGPYITMLGCMTPEKMRGYMKLSILTGGFARRTAFVFTTDRNIVPRPSYTKEQMDAEKRCVEWGREMQKESGPFDATPECWSFYDDWYINNEKQMRDRHPTTKGWFESKGEILWKLCMLISLGEDLKNRMIDIPHYKMALSFCEIVEQNLERVFEGTGINPNASAANQICRMLEALGKPMNLKKVMAAYGDQARSYNELVDTINHLINVGRLASRQVSIKDTVIGTVLATPEVLARYSDADLVVFLLPPSSPPPDQGPDSSPSVGPKVTPPDQPSGSSGAANPDPTGPNSEASSEQPPSTGS